MSKNAYGLPVNRTREIVTNDLVGRFCPLAQSDYQNKKIDLAFVTNPSASVPEGLVTVADS